jgi:hypothetical protein
MKRAIGYLISTDTADFVTGQIRWRGPSLQRLQKNSPIGEFITLRAPSGNALCVQFICNGPQ